MRANKEKEKDYLKCRNFLVRYVNMLANSNNELCLGLQMKEVAYSATFYHSYILSKLLFFMPNDLYIFLQPRETYLSEAPWNSIDQDVNRLVVHSQ